MSLTRLIFTPNNIHKGLDIVKGMSSLQEIGTTLENKIPPAVFWEKYGNSNVKQGN